MADKKEKDLFDLLPFAGSMLIFLGMTRLLVFYGTFGINVVNYLDLSEVLTSFFDVLSTVGLVLAFWFIQIFLTSSKPDDARSLEREAIVEEPNLFLRIGKYFRFYLLSFFAALVAATANFFMDRMIFKDIQWKDLLYSMLFVLIMHIFLCFLIEIEIKHKQFRSSKAFRFGMQVLIYSLVAAIFIVYRATREATDIKEKKRYIGTTIALDDNTKLLSDSITYFVGNTKNYLYIYHEKEKRTDVIPMSRAKMISYPLKGY